MAIEFTNLVGDWRRIVEDYVTDPDNAADAPGVEGTITVTPVLGEGRHAPRGVPSGGVFYTFAPLDLRVYRGLLRDENMNSDITVAIEVDGYPIAWRARFDLQYRRIKIPLQDVIFGPDEIVDGQISLSSLVARDGVPPEYEGSYVQLMDAVAQAAAARDAAEGHADRAESVAAGVEDAAQIVTDNVGAINDLPANIAAVNTARAGAEAARDAADQSAQDAAGSASSAASSASAAASSASAAAGDASAAAGSASDAASSASDAAGSASAAASSASDAAGSASAAAGHASDAGADADRAQQYAEEFDLTATATTGAPGTPAQVTVTGDGPAYSLAFTVPRGDKGDKGDRGDDGEVSQAALDAAVASLVDGAPEALDTLSELADALGNDPNFATTTATAIGERAKIDGAPAAYNTLGKLVTALEAGEIGGSTDAADLTGALTDQVDASAATVDYISPDTGDPGRASLAEVMDAAIGAQYTIGFIGPALASKSDVGHTHTAAEVDGLQAALDGKAATSHTHAEFARVAAAPATWHWSGTALPTSAAQVHAQARVGDFIVAPNLDTDPGWHQITGV